MEYDSWRFYENIYRSSINKDIQELDDSHGLAYFNPNNQTLGFNINQITTEGDAIILILHEEKHILDQYIDWDNTKHIDNSHVGYHQQHSGNGIGQNNRSKTWLMSIMQMQWQKLFII